MNNKWLIYPVNRKNFSLLSQVYYGASKKTSVFSTNKVAEITYFLHSKTTDSYYGNF